MCSAPNVTRVQNQKDLEIRLKRDAQSEAHKFQGSVLVHDETSQGPLSTRWEKGALVQTPAELFASFGNVCIPFREVDRTLQPHLGHYIHARASHARSGAGAT